MTADALPFGASEEYNKFLFMRQPTSNPPVQKEHEQISVDGLDGTNDKENGRVNLHKSLCLIRERGARRKS
jgi:hypothetical protein